MKTFKEFLLFEGIEDDHSEAYSKFHDHIGKVKDIKKRAEFHRRFKTAHAVWTKHYDTPGSDADDQLNQAVGLMHEVGDEVKAHVAKHK